MQCPLCGSNCRQREEKYESYFLCECEACAAQFWNPLKHPGQEYYEELVYRRGRLQWRQKQFLKRPPITKGRLLDIGCGLGNFLFAVKEKYKDIELWGVDISDHFVSFIKENGVEHVYVDDFRAFIKRNDIPRFDVVTMFELIEHVESPKELLDEIKSILNPGGYVVISTPNLDRLGGPFSTEDLPPHHLWRWHPSTLRRLLERGGFKVTRFVEEPLGRDFVWRSLHRLSVFNAIKQIAIDAVTFLTHGRTTRTEKEDSLGRGERKQRRDVLQRRILPGDVVVVIKDVITYIISLPIALIGRILGWKYWDMYVEGKLED